MKNSKALSQMLLMAQMMSGDMEPMRGTERGSTPDRTPQEIREEKEKNKKKSLKKKGVNEYFFGSHSIMTRTKDSAYKIDLGKLQSYKEDGLIRTQTHPYYHNLLIINYTEKVQFEDLWDDFLLQCRGLVINNDNGEILARPFKKFFNIEENRHTPTEYFAVYEKMDGSLGILFKYKGEFIFATRGSFNSDQAREFEKIFFEQVENNKLDPCCLEEGKTYLFEIIYPKNRIVVDYRGERDIILLGVVDNERGTESAIFRYRQFGFNLVKEYNFVHDYRELKHSIGNNREGFVVKFSNGNRCKIKGEKYIRLHKIMTEISTKSIWECLSQGDDIYSLLEGVPDEFFDKIDVYVEKLNSSYILIETVVLEYFIALKNLTPNRTEFAKYAKNSTYRSVLFNMLDNKDYSKAIWNILKPEYKKL